MQTKSSNKMVSKKATTKTKSKPKMVEVKFRQTVIFENVRYDAGQTYKVNENKIKFLKPYILD